MKDLKVNVWTCKIVIAEGDLPYGFDSPPRIAAQAAIEAAGFEVLMNSSGWGGELDESDKEYLSEPKGLYPEIYFAGVVDAPEDKAH